MSLNVQFIVSENKLINEKIVTPRLVSQQTVDYDVFCDYLAQGSTVTADDVSAVMKQMKKKLEATKTECLKNGDTEAAGKIDVDRELKASCLTTGDLQACIVIDLPNS